MSLYDYEQGLKISTKNYPFYALLQACMRKADSDNLERLKYVFPEVYGELLERYNAPGGLLMSERIVKAPGHKEDW